MKSTISLFILEHADIASAVRTVRMQAVEVGFGDGGSYRIATAASELVTNTLVHGGGGLLEIHFPLKRRGIELIATDCGCGIVDVEQAMQEGFSSIGSLGCGLSGIARLMDELTINSQVGQGTSVRACKWL
ncbi:ATP-binding protein [Herbaspirillum sp. RTI4]|uniref:ATP-binding protein n=1 Tax=Herbaspirillum sp. RTI4 TaxID=3048640 RepID=UPI002AB54EFE|nr:ATP-binding protein [Herbaspirillum sp. RTI4]MDY7579158.1 ATP-binding protein [Herbaspirillum sp. RTI4]MEA9981263.1 ATP-binding protein [Herbaspirillum sp. RTI4]